MSFYTCLYIPFNSILDMWRNGPSDSSNKQFVRLNKSGEILASDDEHG